MGVMYFVSKIKNFLILTGWPANLELSENLITGKISENFMKMEF